MECEEILWCKDDIEIMVAMLTLMPTSVVGSCRSKGDPGDDDGNEEGKGGDDKGKKSSPLGMSPPPPLDSPPTGPINEAGTSGAPSGGKTMPARQSSTSEPPPPPSTEPTCPNGGLRCMEGEPGTQTPPITASQLRGTDPGEDATMLLYMIMFERYVTVEHNIQFTFLPHIMILTLLSLFFQA
jgi:hypothetical protein